MYCPYNHTYILLNNHNKSIRDFRHQTQHFASERDGQIVKASRAIEHIDAVRIPRAQFADQQRRVDDLIECLTRLRKDNDQSECYPITKP